MNLLERVVKAVMNKPDNTVMALQKQVRVLTEQSINGFWTNTGRYVAPTWEEFKNAERYCTTDDLYSIVSLIATTAAMIPIYPYEVKNEAATKKLRDLSPTSSQRLHKSYQVKALTELLDSDIMAQLLEQPNEQQSKFEFMEQIYSTLLIQGECFIWKYRVEFGPTKGKVRQLLFLFPQFVQMVIYTGWPQQIAYFRYIVNGVTIMDKIDPADIIHIKYFNPNFSLDGYHLRGFSPIKILARRLARMDSEMDVSVSQLQNGGVPGVIYDETPYGDATAQIEAQGQRKENFYRYLSNSANKGAPFFANGKMGYLPTGMALTDMEVAELEKIDFKKLCNAYHVSDILFNNGEASTESNVQEMQKRLYTNSALPNVFRLRDAFNKFLVPDFTDKKRMINCDLSEIAELQENTKDLVTWLAGAWWITPNEKRECQKFDESDEEGMDDIYIPTTLMSLDDMNTGVEPVEDPNEEFGKPADPNNQKPDPKKKP